MTTKFSKFDSFYCFLVSSLDKIFFYYTEKHSFSNIKKIMNSNEFKIKLSKNVNLIGFQVKAIVGWNIYVGTVVAATLIAKFKRSNNSCFTQA